MDDIEFEAKYKSELSKLIEDENNFERLREVLSEHRNRAPFDSKENFNSIISFATKNNLNSVKAWTYYYYGWYFFDLSKYENAVNYFLISKELFENMGNKKGLIYSCNGLTNVYCQMGQLKLANEWGLKGISLCEEIKERDALVLLLVNTSINYIQMKQFYRAQEIYKSIEFMNFELSGKQTIACNLILAEIEINIGKPEKALEYLANAENTERNLGFNTELSEIYKLKAMTFARIQLYDAAEAEFKKSLYYSEENNNFFEKCSAILEISSLLNMTGKKTEAINMLNEVVLICSYKSFNVLLREAYHKLYEIYRELDLTREALSNLEKYISINDKIYDYEQNQLMVKMNLKNTEREADLYRKLYDKTELLSSIGQKIISNLDIDHIIQIIKKEINSLMSLDYFGIAVYDNQNKEAVYHFVNTMNGEKKVLPFKFDNNDTFGAYCINKKKDIIIGDIEKEYKYYLDSYPINIDGSKMIQSAIYTPLCIQDKVVGLMTVQSLNVDSYDKNDLNTLKIVANYTAIAVDNAMSYKKVENIAIYDNMTGFLTKSEIIRLGNIMYENYKSNKESFCVMMLDVDNFKNINDTYGHLLGDKAMVMLSEAISGNIRNTDYIGRYGGDEFLLICPGASLDEAKDVAERIRKAVFSKDFILGTDISVKITISIGVYELGKDDDSFIDGIRMADKYLYNAKNSLKNKVVCSLASFTI